MRLRVGTPIWLVGGPPRGRRYPTLIGNHEADVAIVGGGMTGAGIAHEFTAAGLRVVLVDADLVGRGSTAASTALLMQETDEELAARLLLDAVRNVPNRDLRLFAFNRV